MQRIYLLDTNIISELRAKKQNPNVIKKIKENISVSCISSLVFDELLFGARRMAPSSRKDDIFNFYVDFVQAEFDIIPFDFHASWIHSDISEKLEKNGTPAPKIDSMIAATAIANNLVLVTRNVKDFDNIRKVSSLMLENWFEE